MTRLNVYEWGERQRPPVICLHGLATHGERFRKLAEERLADRFRVLSLDLRGHGRSPIEPPWNLAAHVRDVLETVDASNVGRASWIGASFGGRLILEIASGAPGRVERAILLDPALQQTPSTSLENAERERNESFFQSPEEAIQARLGSPMFAKTPREFLEEDTAQHLEPMPDGRFRFRYCHGAVVTAWAELCLPLPPIRALPMLVVTGQDSGFVTDDQMKPLRAQVGDSLTEMTVPGGHAVLWDAFPRVADEIDAFLAASSRNVKNKGANGPSSSGYAG